MCITDLSQMKTAKKKWASPKVQVIKIKPETKEWLQGKKENSPKWS